MFVFVDKNEYFDKHLEERWMTWIAKSQYGAPK